MEAASGDLASLRVALRALAATLQSHDARDAFLRAGGAAALRRCLEQQSPAGSPFLSPVSGFVYEVK